MVWAEISVWSSNRLCKRGRRERKSVREGGGGKSERDGKGRRAREGKGEKNGRGKDWESTDQERLMQKPSEGGRR